MSHLTAPPSTPVRTPPTPSAGHIDAMPYVDFVGESVALELSGVAIDECGSRNYADGTVTLNRAATLDLIRSLGASLGMPEATEQFLTDTFGWER